MPPPKVPSWVYKGVTWLIDRPSTTAGYHSAYIAMLIGYTIKLLAVVVLYIYMWRVNKARDAAGHINDRAAIERGMHDETELDNPGFRYSL